MRVNEMYENSNKSKNQETPRNRYFVTMGEKTNREFSVIEN